MDESFFKVDNPLKKETILKKCYICKLNNLLLCNNCIKNNILKKQEIISKKEYILDEIKSELSSHLNKKNKVVLLKNNINKQKNINLILTKRIKELKLNIKNTEYDNANVKFNLNLKLEHINKKLNDLQEFKNKVNFYENKSIEKNITNNEKECSILVSQKIEELNNIFKVKVDYANNCGYICNLKFPLDFNNFKINYWDTINESISTLILLLLFLKSILNIISFKTVIKKGIVDYFVLLSKVKFCFYQICNILNIKSNNSSLEIINVFHLFSNKLDNSCLFNENNLKKKIFIK